MKRLATGSAHGFLRKKARKGLSVRKGASPMVEGKAGKKRKLEGASVPLSGGESNKKIDKKVVAGGGTVSEQSDGKLRRKKARKEQQKKGSVVHQALVREGAEAEDDFMVEDVGGGGQTVEVLGEDGQAVKKRKKQQKAKLPAEVEGGNGGLGGNERQSAKGVITKSPAVIKKVRMEGGKKGKSNAENGKGRQKKDRDEQAQKQKKDNRVAALASKRFTFVSPPENGTPGAMAAWFQSAYTGHFGVEISPLEMAEITGDRVVELPLERPRTLADLAGSLKNMVGPSWKDDLLEKDLASGRHPGESRDPGSPVVLIISSSAKRCVDILRSVNEFGHKCKPAKLFAKHFKVGEQVAMLQERVNIAAGTPDRLGKLAAMGALGLGELRFVVIDMLKNAKNCTLFDIPEIRKAFWDLYRAHLHERVVQERMQLCFY